jgi:protein required for attachment to host cells
MRNHTKTTWILVAHGAGAIVFQSHGPGLPLARIDQIHNPRGRLKAGELEADRPGRAFDRHGGGRHAHSKEQNAPDHVDMAFAAQLAEHLEQGRVQSKFERLVLIAPAKMLGKLRAALSEPMRPLLVASLAKDLGHTDAEEVRKHLIDLALV